MLYKTQVCHMVLPTVLGIPLKSRIDEQSYTIVPSLCGPAMRRANEWPDTLTTCVRDERVTSHVAVLGDHLTPYLMPHLTPHLTASPTLFHTSAGQKSLTKVLELGRGRGLLEICTRIR